MALIIFRDFLKLILVLSFLSILLVTGALGKIFVQDNVINEDTLNNWAGNDKYRKSRATEFNERCLAQSARDFSPPLKGGASCFTGCNLV